MNRNSWALDRPKDDPRRWDRAAKYTGIIIIISVIVIALCVALNVPSSHELEQELSPVSSPKQLQQIPEESKTRIMNFHGMCVFYKNYNIDENLIK